MTISVTLLLCLSSVAAFRMQEKRMIASQPQPKTYKVQLLVTRHGLSCANVAQKWIGNYDVGRSFMHDTLLSAAGESTAKESAKEVEQWLESNGFGIDAVLSSVLARAMQTAYYMFPKHAETLHVMPYIREIGMGFSNAPKPQSQQPAHLQSALGEQHVALNYTWVNEFGSALGTWEEFLLFLEQFFLPELISTKGADSTITLPVVTHSNFMKDNLGKCSKAWKAKGESKPLNNQVVNMVYTFELEAGNRTKDVPAFFVHGSDYKDGRLNGAWVKLKELQSGRPQYEKQTDSKCKIQWSQSRKAWRMYVDNDIKHGRTTLFQSKVDSPTVPMDGWGAPEEDGIKGLLKDALPGLSPDKEVYHGSIPRFVLYNAQYKLKEASEIPCEEVASGLSLKDKGGKLSPARLCARDVGDRCRASIENKSLAASWLDIAEDVLTKEYADYEIARISYSENEKAFKRTAQAVQEMSNAEGTYESVPAFGSSSEVTKVMMADKIEEQASLARKLQFVAYEMGKQQKLMKDKHAIVSDVAAQKCLMGGHPVTPF